MLLFCFLKADNILYIIDLQCVINFNLKFICQIHKHLTTHCLRHTFATLAIEYGMPIDIIAKILGHTNTNMTRRYAKISEANISREMRRIGKVLTA